MSSTPGQTSRREVFSVSRLNREARGLLEGAFPLIWVEGELSNLARPASGHLYFTLKDAGAQVSCALFRNRGRQLGFRPADGMQVLVRARVSLYEPRGSFQLIVEHMEEAGDGALRRAFEALKHRLAAEGLFEEARKRPLPAWPRCIGVITSPRGAAIRDVLTVLGRRFPAIPVVVYPVPVQGEGAAAEIVRALRAAERRADCDVLLLTRGGGSLEDLQPFNEEALARAVAACELPVVSAIGHEIDFVITDFVADRRAPTPSAAAELLSPDVRKVQESCATFERRLRRAQDERLAQARQRLRWLSRRLQQQHPGQRLLQQNQRLDELEQRLRLALGHHHQHLAARLRELAARLRQHTPRHRLRDLRGRCDALQRRLQQAMLHRLEGARRRLAEGGRALELVSPLATLQRGYSITLAPPGGRVLRDAGQVQPGDRLETRLARGRVFSEVLSTEEE